MAHTPQKFHQDGDLGLLEDFSSLLQPHLTLIPSHVKRDANKIADFLANEGVDSKEEQIQLDARISPPPRLMIRYIDIARREYPPWMWWHVVEGRSCSPHAIQAINMVSRHPKPHSWMGNGHKRTRRMEGQLPCVGLMLPSLSHGRGMTIGMGGGCAVLLSPQILLQVGHGIHHSVSLLCRGFALLSYPVLGLSDFSSLILIFLWPPGFVMPHERGKTGKGSSWYYYFSR